MGAGQGLVVTAFNFLEHKEVANDDAILNYSKDGGPCLV